MITTLSVLEIYIYIKSELNLLICKEFNVQATAESCACKEEGQQRERGIRTFFDKYERCDLQTGCLSGFLAPCWLSVSSAAPAVPWSPSRQGLRNVSTFPRLYVPRYYSDQRSLFVIVRVHLLHLQRVYLQCDRTYLLTEDASSQRRLFVYPVNPSLPLSDCGLIFVIYFFFDNCSL